MTKCFLDAAFSSGESIGRIVVQLEDQIVPKTCANFRSLCTGKDGMTYKGTLFNRIIPDFMVQGGKVHGPKESTYGGRFEDENFQLKHEKEGVLSMANRGPNTNGTSFFIITAKNGTPWLDGHHVVFGHVVQGMDVVKKIESYGCGSGAPSQEIIIKDCGELSV